MLTDEQRELASDPEAIRGARLIARRFARVYPDVDRDDFESAAMLAVVEAASRFDGRGRFPGYSGAVVILRLKDVLRANPKGGPAVYPLIDSWDSLTADLTDRSPPAGEFDEQHEEIEASITCLPWVEQRELVRDLFLRCRDDGQQVRVARRRGVSKVAVNRSFQRLAVRLRAIVMDRGVLVTRGAA